MMLRMKRRVMRRLVNTFLIEMNRPEGFIEQQDFASQPFGTLVVRDIALERTSRRFFPSDKISRREPSGRFCLC